MLFAATGKSNGYGEFAERLTRARHGLDRPATIARAHTAAAELEVRKRKPCGKSRRIDVCGWKMRE